MEEEKKQVNSFGKKLVLVAGIIICVIAYVLFGLLFVTKQKEKIESTTDWLYDINDTKHKHDWKSIKFQVYEVPNTVATIDICTNCGIIRLNPNSKDLIK